MISFTAGVGFAWAVFGFAGTSGFGDAAGSRADWVAAMGTWAIGVAAAYYARESHKQRLGEYREARRSERDAKKKMFDATILRLNRAELLVEMYRDVPQESGDRKADLEDMKAIMVALRGIVPVLFWPADEVRLLTGETQRLIIHIENSLIAIQQMLQLAAVAEMHGVYDEYFTQHETIRESCNDIQLLCAQALQHVLEERSAL
ncbi:hypothetical protein ACTUVK_001216 [Stenotrophomonas rhizophila]